jgi:hypothetical protein
MYVCIHVKYPLILSNFNETLIFSTYFREKIQVSNFIKIRAIVAELFLDDGRTDMTSLKDAFHNFAHVPKSIPTSEFRGICPASVKQS